MKHTILIIDDEKSLCQSMQKSISVQFSFAHTMALFEEKTIVNAVQNSYYTIAIVDMRMDNYEIDGIMIIRTILENNPFAKIIVVSAHIKDYLPFINEFSSTGKIIAVVEKNNWDSLINDLINNCQKIIRDYDDNMAIVASQMADMLSESKNEIDTYKKGINFERFVIFLFSQIGFVNIQQRVKDQSSGETDLIMRNELNDLFFQKFKPYILVECKNTSSSVGKNEFIAFYDKLANTNGLSDLGILITTNVIAKTTYIEAIRKSEKPQKIVFIDINGIKRLIESDNLLETFKKIIDEQVKDS